MHLPPLAQACRCRRGSAAPTALPTCAAHGPQEETHEPPAARPVPLPPGADVKYNTAAILREEFLYRKRAEEEARALMHAEVALRDGAGDYEARNGPARLLAPSPRCNS